MSDEQTLHDKDSRTFGENEEQAIIALAFDLPEFFSSVVPYLQIDHFKHIPSKFLFAIIKKLIEKHRVSPTRGLVKDIARKNLTVDDDYEPILSLIDKQSDPREAPVVKQSVVEFAKRRALGLLYSKEVMEEVSRGNFDRVNEIVESARKITDVSQTGIWFFERAHELFTEENEIKFTTGFPKLDRYINDGGPTISDVFVWMAPTNVGKTYMLCNTGEANVRAGHNVVHFSFEGDIKKTQVRYAGAFTNVPVVTHMHRMAHKDQITQILSRCKAHYGAELVLYKFPADEVSVDTLHQVMDFLRRNKGFNPRVVIIDYLELMVSRNKFMNRDDYARQKSISTELCGFADKENVAVFTATQTNRYGMNEEEQSSKKTAGTGGGKSIDLDKIAESFGKSMPLSYVVSINQTKNEYEAGYDASRAENTAARARLFIAKNRNGPKSETVAIRMNYVTMKAKEDEPAVNITTVGGNS